MPRRRAYRPGTALLRTEFETAAEQHQLDVYGQLLDLLHRHSRTGGALPPRLREVGTALANHVAARWREPDHGIWEPRLAPRRHVHSAIMAWTAPDRASDLFGPRADWDAAAAEILAEIRSRGVHPSGRALMQVMGEKALDAAVLIAPIVALPIEEATLARTVDAVMRQLGEGRLVWRYRNDDGLPEEMAADGTVRGNFPQACTHLGLLQSALLIELHDAAGAGALRGSHADRARRMLPRGRQGR